MTKRMTLTHEEVITLARATGEVETGWPVSEMARWMTVKLGKRVSEHQARDFAEKAGIKLKIKSRQGTLGRHALSTLLARMFAIHLKELGATVPVYLRMAADGFPVAEVQEELRREMERKGRESLRVV